MAAQNSLKNCGTRSFMFLCVPANPDRVTARVGSSVVKTARKRAWKVARGLLPPRTQPFSWRNDMFVTRTNPRESAGAFPALTDRIQRALSESLGGLDWMYRDSAAASWVPAVDVVEEPDAIRITAEIPGVKPEDFKISPEGNLLT